MTPADIITLVRGIIKDEDVVSLRFSEATLLRHVNNALKRIAIFRPDLFTTIADVALTQNSIVQQVPDRGRVMEIFRVVGGNALREVTRESLDELAPDWPTHTAGPPVNWIRHNRDPSIFLVYPQASVGLSVSAQYTVAPPSYAADEEIALNDSYQPVLVDMTVAEVEWADDEHVLSQRAETCFNRAKEALGVTSQTKQLTDLEQSGADPKVQP